MELTMWILTIYCFGLTFLHGQGETIAPGFCTRDYQQNPLHRVFVYGTLKRGHPFHYLLENTTNGYAKFLSVAETVSKYPLVIATKYNVPFLLKEQGIGHQIIGEVYDVDSKMLEKLDELELHPTLYVRTEEDVRLLSSEDQCTSHIISNENNLSKAWIYLFPNFKPELLQLQMFTNYSTEGRPDLVFVKKAQRDDPSFNLRKEVTA